MKVPCYVYVCLLAVTGLMAHAQRPPDTYVDVNGPHIRLSQRHDVACGLLFEPGPDVSQDERDGSRNTDQNGSFPVLSALPGE
jgi:hypothetical protein